jgi:hypothetical protein
MKKIFILGGVLAILFGLLFVGQGLGYINWPASSFMLRDLQWAFYGAAIALAGIGLVFIGWRKSGSTPPL